MTLLRKLRKSEYSIYIRNNFFNLIIELWLCSTFMVHVLVLRRYTLKNLEVKCSNVYNLLLTGIDKMRVYVDRERE